MDIPQVLAVWLHTVAFVIAWGYYGILARIVVPGLEAAQDRTGQAASLIAIERRALPLVALSLVLFTVTGTYLLVSDQRYSGLGDVFASDWTTLLLVKHVLVVVLVVLGVAVDRFVRAVGTASGEASQGSALRRVRIAAEAATAVGALIALVTAAAQATA